MAGKQAEKASFCKKSIEIIFGYLCLALVVFSCAPSQEKILSVTHTPEIIKTPEFTATPEFTLQCNIIQVDLEKEERPINVFAFTGQVIEGVQDFYLDALQVDIIGESGQPIPSGNTSTDIDNQGIVSIKIDKEWAFADSSHTYKIEGTIGYGISNMQKMIFYEITVTGGGFGTTPYICKYP